MLWTRTGSQGLAWWKAQVNIMSDPNNPVTQIGLQGVVGTGTKGDVVIDDINMTSGSCRKFVCNPW